MEHPSQVVQDAPTRPHDPLAVAVANASLFNAGYLMMGRYRLAAATGLVTVGLIVGLTVVFRAAWLEVALLLWWAALTGHGWSLAARTPRPDERRAERMIALGVTLAVTLPVLTTVGVLRFDAVAIDRTVAEARRDGDCAKALDAVEKIRFGHRLVAAPQATRGDETAGACRRLAAATDDLQLGMKGDTAALAEGFDGLAAILADAPGHEKMVDATLGWFLGGLSTTPPCLTAQVTDWLRGREASNDLLDRSARVVQRVAPAALVRCGDRYMTYERWDQARTRYQQLLDQYPDNALAAEAEAGVRKATLAIELGNVRELLEAGSGSNPRYCSAPAKYSGADPYDDGTNRALFYGADEITGDLPDKWRTTDAADAVLVVCLGEQGYGPVERSCAYTYDGGKHATVSFHKIEIPVKAYELRTGKLVADTEVRISGGSCPAVIPYTTYGTDAGPPEKKYVDPSDSDIRDAFESLITGG